MDGCYSFQMELEGEDSEIRVPPRNPRNPLFRQHTCQILYTPHFAGYLVFGFSGIFFTFYSEIQKYRHTFGL